MKLSFRRVSVLPTTLESGCIYFETSTGKITIATSSSEKELFGGLQDVEWNEESRNLILTPAVGEPITVQIPEAGVTSFGGQVGAITLDTLNPTETSAKPVMDDSTLKIQAFDWSTAINNAKNNANLKGYSILSDWNFDPAIVDSNKDGVYFLSGGGGLLNQPEPDSDNTYLGLLLTYNTVSNRLLILGKASSSTSYSGLYCRRYITGWGPWFTVASIEDLNTKLNIDGTNATEATITQLIQQLTANSTEAVNDGTEFLSQSSNASTPTKWYRKPLSTLWTYIKSKLATVATTGSQWDLNNSSIDRVVKIIPNFTTAQWIRIISPTAQFKLENIILNLQTEFVNLATNSVEVHIRAAYVDAPEVMILRNNAASNVISKLRIGRVNKSSGNAVVDVLIQPNAGEMSLCSVLRILNAYTSETLSLDTGIEPVSANISDEYPLLNEYDLTSSGLSINNIVKANSIVKEGGTSSQVLLADGSVKELSDIDASNKQDISYPCILYPNMHVAAKNGQYYFQDTPNPAYIFGVGFLPFKVNTLNGWKMAFPTKNIEVAIGCFDENFMGIGLMYAQSETNFWYNKNNTSSSDTINLKANTAYVSISIAQSTWASINEDGQGFVKSVLGFRFYNPTSGEEFNLNDFNTIPIPANALAIDSAKLYAKCKELEENKQDLYSSVSKSSSFTADPNVVYVVTLGSSDITITIPSSAAATDNFIFQVDKTGSGKLTFSGVSHYAGGSMPTMSIDKRYEFNILNGYVLWAEF